VNSLGEGLWFYDNELDQPVLLSDPSAAAVPVCGVAAVALQRIMPGEEVFLDYRYNLADPQTLPSWYVPVTATPTPTAGAGAGAGSKDRSRDRDSAKEKVSGASVPAPPMPTGMSGVAHV
jgi:hypothetical protein